MLEGSSLRALAAALAALATGAGCTLLLDFDATDGGIDGAASDAPAGDATTSARCTAFEPNDTIATAMALDAGPTLGAVCPAADADFYSFAIAAGDGFTLNLSFVTASGGDLDMRLHRVADEALVTVSMGTGDSEKIEHRPALGNQLPAGMYAVEVYGFEQATQNDYTLDFTFEPAAMVDAGVSPP